jgi:hypothetical protein
MDIDIAFHVINPNRTREHERLDTGVLKSREHGGSCGILDPISKKGKGRHRIAQVYFDSNPTAPENISTCSLGFSRTEHACQHSQIIFEKGREQQTHIALGSIF